MIAPTSARMKSRYCLSRNDLDDSVMRKFLSNFSDLPSWNSAEEDAFFLTFPWFSLTMGTLTGVIPNILEMEYVFSHSKSPWAFGWEKVKTGEGAFI